MNKLEIKGNWKELEGKLKHKYGSLIKDDELYAEGKAEELIGVIEKKTGKQKEAIIEEINSIS